jgi:hydroxymethylglutaryl-CoA lyase
MTELAGGGQRQTSATAANSTSRQGHVTVVEVGPRDGLQNEPVSIPTDRKVAFIDALTATGLTVIETTSFVNPKAVPQLADAEDVMRRIRRRPGVRYPVLIPNSRGLERAFEADVDAIALFTAATEAFAMANVGTTIDGTFERFQPVVEEAVKRGVWIRGYVSVAFGCPYSGEVDPEDVATVAHRLLAMGCDEICLADTIGDAQPKAVRRTVMTTLESIPAAILALHMHDSSGMAIANVETGLELGVRTFDAAAGGLGGCPFAPGAPGNLATEKLLGRLAELGLHTGVDVEGIRSAVAILSPFVPKLENILT